MPKNKPREEKKPIGERISALLARTIRFVTYDIWRITENEVSGLKEIYINIIKTVILAVRGFQSEPANQGVGAYLQYLVIYRTFAGRIIRYS